MVRTERCKYVFIPRDMDGLYDLKADSPEMNNLIEESEYCDILEEMRARLIGWNDATNDVFQWAWVRWSLPKSTNPYPVGNSSTELQV